MSATSDPTSFSYGTPAGPDTAGLTGSTSSNSLGSLFSATTSGLQTLDVVLTNILSDNKKIAFEPYNVQFTLSDGTTGYSALHYATSIDLTGLSALSDINITSLSDNELLQYDNSTSKWINQTLAEAGVATSADPVLTGTVSGNAFLDEDNMASNSATKLASQQSIKAYVDAQVDTADSLAELSDVTITGTPADNELLAYDTSASKWINQTSAEASLQPLDAGLTSISGLTTAADKMIYTTDADVYAVTTLTSAGRAILDDADATAQRTTLGLRIGAISGIDDATIEIDSTNLRVKADGITNTHIKSDAAIADTKLATISTAGKVSLTALEIDGGTDVGADLVDADLIIIDDGAGGTNRKSTLTRAKKYIYSAISGDATVSDAGALTIAGTSVENSMLAGSIANAKLSNSTVSYGGVSLALGASDATPAFNLSDATNYPTSSLSGTITNAQLAGSIANAKLSNSSITVSDGSSSTATALGGTITFAGTTNEVEVGESSGTITVGLPDNVTIGGNLTVSGTTTTVNTATLSVEDPLIKLANNNSGSDAVDIGFYGLYDTSGSQDLYAGLFRDANDSGKFKLFKDLQAEPTTTVNTSGTGYAAGTLVASLEGNVTGNVSGTSGSTTGNAATATALATARTIGGTSFDGTANIAVALSATATALANARTIGGTSFDGTANIAVALSATATALASARTIGGVSFDGTGNIDLPGVNAAGNQNTSGTADLITATANNSANETVYPTFVDGATGSQGLETDTGLNYNPSTGVLTSTAFTGNLTGNVTGNVSGSSGSSTGNAATATALETARTIGGTSFDGTGNIAVALASVGTAVTVADESSDTTCFPLFTTAATGDLPPKSGSNLTFNSSSGTLAATAFSGDGSNLTGVTVADNAITLAKMAGLARGKLITGDASGDPSAFALGSNGQYLKSDGDDLVWGSATISGLAADDLTIGDSAVSIATTSGNITIDAQANDADVIIKVDDAGSSITAVTFDGSDAGTATFNSGINTGGDVVITSTDAGAGEDPNIVFYRNSSSPADWDELGTINFRGRNDASQDVEYAQINAVIEDMTDGTENGRISFETMRSGTMQPSIYLDSWGHLNFLGDDAKIVWHNQNGTSYDGYLTWNDLTASRNVYLPDADGTVLINSGNQTISSGNLVIGTAGKGIDFSATGNATTNTSELFSDYEEGTWVPSASADSGGFTISSSYNTLYYSKIGRVVCIYGYLYTSAISSPSGKLIIGNLPYTSANTTTNYAAIDVRVSGISSESTGRSHSSQVFARIDPNATTLLLYDTTSTTLSATSGNWLNIDASTDIYINGCYMV